MWHGLLRLKGISWVSQYIIIKVKYDPIELLKKNSRSKYN